jgi:ParB/RepB/Spo0J family partition protein
MNNKSEQTPLSSLAASLGNIALLDNEAASITFMVDLDDVEVVAQVREQMEDATQTIADLAESFKVVGQQQAIVIRANPNTASTKPFRLVAGERRYRAAKLNGWTKLEAKNAGDIDEERANLIQLIENIHRKDLTLVEIGKQVELQIKRLGSAEAAAKFFGKSESWVSKARNMAELPPATKALLTEGVLANREALAAVKFVETNDPEKAKTLVQAIKDNNAKGSGERVNTREMAEKAAIQTKKDIQRGTIPKPTSSTKPSKEDPNEPKQRGQTLSPKVDTTLPLDLGNNSAKPAFKPLVAVQNPPADKSAKALGRFATLKEGDDFIDRAIRYIDKNYFTEGRLDKQAVKEIAADGNCAGFISQELKQAHKLGTNTKKDAFAVSLRRQLRDKIFNEMGFKSMVMQAFCEGFAGVEFSDNLEDYQ